MLAMLRASRDALGHSAAPVPERFVLRADCWIGATHVSAGYILSGLPLLKATVPVLLQATESFGRRRRNTTFIGRELMPAGRHKQAAANLQQALADRRASGSASTRRPQVSVYCKQPLADLEGSLCLRLPPL